MVQANLTTTFNYSREEAYNTAWEWISSYTPLDDKCEIIDNETGEVLFTYDRGNVQYIAKEFAKGLMIWAFLYRERHGITKPADIED